MNRLSYVGFAAIVLACGADVGCGRSTSGWQYNGEFGLGSISPFPNQSAIVYSFSGSGPSHIYSVSWRGQRTQQLTRDARADSDVCVSPDGKFIVFVRQDGSNVHLWRMNPNGTGQRQLTFGPGCETQPAISPNGRRIAYVVSSPTPGSTYALGVISVNGTQRRLTSSSTATQDTTPTFDPTGTRVYFTRFWLNNSLSLRGEVWAINISGTGAHRIGFGDDPAVSPNGAQVAFFDEPQNQTLGIMNANGTGRAIVGRSTGYGTCVRYSPDGHSLLVVGGDISHCMIWSIPTGGLGRRTIITVQ